MILFFSVLVLTIVNVSPYPDLRQAKRQALGGPTIETNSLERNNEQIPFYSINLKPKNFDDTVREVEKIIASNPALPRLTKGEIIDILENITTTDSEKSRLLSGGRNPKAIMVVMPYTPNSNEKDMEHLYTKPPVTHIVGAKPFKPTPNLENRKITKPTVTSAIKEELKVSTQPQSQQKVEKIAFRRRKPSNNRGNYTASYSENTIGYESTTTKRSRFTNRGPSRYTQEPTESTSFVTTYHPSSNRPTRRRTIPTRYPNHNYETDRIDSFPEKGGIHLVDPPKLSPFEINEDLLSDLKLAATNDNESFLTESTTVTTTTTTEKSVTKPKILVRPPIDDIVAPEFQEVVGQLGISEIPLDRTEIKLNSHYVHKNIGTDSNEDQKDVSDVLSSIGAIPNAQTTTMANLGEVADNLSPDMKNLLMTFGLIPNPNEEQPKAEEENTDYSDDAGVDPHSYVGFKPLPENDSSKGEMEQLLASFGLGRSARKEKAVKNIQNRSYNFDVIPESYKNIIKDIGLEERHGKEIQSSSASINNFDEHVETSSDKHVFSPTDIQQATEKELEKLQKIMTMIKHLKKMTGSVTKEDLDTIDQDSLSQLTKEINEQNAVPLNKRNVGPDPLNEDTGLVKNEVKRQESATEVTIIVANSTELPEENKTPSLVDLESSFGGKPEVTVAPAPETTTINRKSGFYSFVDWNTFLDIDDTKGRRVNLRFQPTIGDPKRFLSVSVP